MAKCEKMAWIRVTLPVHVIRKVQARAREEDVAVEDYIIWLLNKAEVAAKAAGMTPGDYVWWTSVQVEAWRRTRERTQNRHESSFEVDFTVTDSIANTPHNAAMRRLK